jgi:hypothetical protein
MRRSLFDAVLAAALFLEIATLAGAVPDGDGSSVALGRWLPVRRLLDEAPRAGRARDFLAIRYLLTLNDDYSKA